LAYGTETLEIPGDANASLISLQRLAQAVADFLDRHLTSHQ